MGTGIDCDAEHAQQQGHSSLWQWTREVVGDVLEIHKVDVVVRFHVEGAGTFRGDESALAGEAPLERREVPEIHVAIEIEVHSTA